MYRITLYNALGIKGNHIYNDYDIKEASYFIDYFSRNRKQFSVEVIL